MPYARVGDVSLYYERTGSGEPLLWVPGFAISAEACTPVLPLYASSYECIAYDNRLTGRSSSGSRTVSIPRLAADAVQLLDRLGVESAHVYGLSYGGMVAQEIAIRFPHRVRGLVLGGTTPGGPLAVRPTLRELRALGAGVLGTPGRRGISAALFSEEFRRSQPHEAVRLARNLLSHPAPVHGMAAHFLASVYHDTMSRLPMIAAPTLVLHGDGDRMAPLENARLLAARIPGAELAVVPGAGHAYLLENAEESARLALEFLGRRSPTAGPRRRSRVEPLSRRFGLTVGAARTGRSLVRLATARGSRERLYGTGTRPARRPAGIR